MRRWRDDHLSGVNRVLRANTGEFGLVRLVLRDAAVKQGVGVG